MVWAIAVEATDLLAQSNEALIRLAMKDMVDTLPATVSAPHVIESEVIRQPQAYLTPKPATQQYRPLSSSPFPNFFMAGDWTDTGWPANLESAILSGQRCAEAISG